MSQRKPQVSVIDLIDLDRYLNYPGDPRKNERSPSTPHPVSQTINYNRHKQRDGKYFVSNHERHVITQKLHEIDELRSKIVELHHVLSSNEDTCVNNGKIEPEVVEILPKKYDFDPLSTEALCNLTRTIPKTLRKRKRDKRRTHTKKYPAEKDPGYQITNIPKSFSFSRNSNEEIQHLNEKLREQNRDIKAIKVSLQECVDLLRNKEHDGKLPVQNDYVDHFMQSQNVFSCKCENELYEVEGSHKALLTVVKAKKNTKCVENAMAMREYESSCSSSKSNKTCNKKYLKKKKKFESQTTCASTCTGTSIDNLVCQNLIDKCYRGKNLVMQVSPLAPHNIPKDKEKFKLGEEKDNREENTDTERDECAALARKHQLEMKSEKFEKFEYSKPPYQQESLHPPSPENEPQPQEPERVIKREKKRKKHKQHKCKVCEELKKVQELHTQHAHVLHNVHAQTCGAYAPKTCPNRRPRNCFLRCLLCFFCRDF